MIEYIATTQMVKLAEGGYTTNSEIADMIKRQNEKSFGSNIGGAIGAYGGAQLGGELAKRLVSARGLSGWHKLLASALGTGLGAGGGLFALRGVGGLLD